MSAERCTGRGQSVAWAIRLRSRARRSAARTSPTDDELAAAPHRPSARLGWWCECLATDRGRLRGKRWQRGRPRALGRRTSERRADHDRRGRHDSTVVDHVRRVRDDGAHRILRFGERVAGCGSSNEGATGRDHGRECEWREWSVRAARAIRGGLLRWESIVLHPTSLLHGGPGSRSPHRSANRELIGESRRCARRLRRKPFRDAATGVRCAVGKGRGDQAWRIGSGHRRFRAQITVRGSAVAVARAPGKISPRARRATRGPSARRDELSVANVDRGRRHSRQRKWRPRSDPSKPTPPPHGPSPSRSLSLLTDPAKPEIRTRRPSRSLSLLTDPAKPEIRTRRPRDR